MDRPSLPPRRPFFMALNQVGGRPLVREAMTNSELARASASRPAPAAHSSRRASWRDRHGCCRGRPAAARQATDLSVAQAVVTEGENPAGDRDLGDLLASPFRDPLEVLAQRAPAADAVLRGLDESPAQRP